MPLTYSTMNYYYYHMNDTGRLLKTVRASGLILFTILIAGTLGYSKNFEGVNVYDLPHDFHQVIDSIQVEILDAFEGSRIAIDWEEHIYNLGNSLHIKTRLSTVHRLLLFSAGDAVSRKLLIESERNLRQVPFLADAKIYLRPAANSTSVKVVVYDQWSTTPGSSIKRLGGQWTYWFGLKESNILGSGQTLSLSYHKGFLNSYLNLEYYNPSFSKERLRYYLLIKHSDEGRGITGRLVKPLRSKTDRSGYQFSFGTQTGTNRIFWDANLVNNSENESIPVGIIEGKSNSVIEFPDVKITRIYGAYTWSFGLDLKFNTNYFISIYRRESPDNTLYLAGIEEFFTPAVFQLPTYNDRLVGIKFDLYASDYSTTRNFRQLKWTEDIEQGWAVSLVIGRDLGISSREYYLAPHFSISTGAGGVNYVRLDLASACYYRPGSGTDRGKFSANLEWISKPTGINSNLLSVEWSHLFQAHPTTQLLLGEFNGLYGYPNYYYAGQARYKLLLESRFLPAVEIFTIAPALTVFYVGGNTFPAAQDFSFNNLHHAVGIGLRLGLTRSAGSVINHINLSWPLEKGLPKPVLSIQSKTTL